MMKITFQCDVISCQIECFKYILIEEITTVTFNTTNQPSNRLQNMLNNV